jgi:hypothetical protein
MFKCGPKVSLDLNIQLLLELSVSKTSDIFIGRDLLLPSRKLTFNARLPLSA